MATILAHDVFSGTGNDNSPIASDALSATPTKAWAAGSEHHRLNGAATTGPTDDISWVASALQEIDFEAWFESSGTDDAASFDGGMLFWVTSIGNADEAYVLEVFRNVATGNRQVTFRTHDGTTQDVVVESGVAWPTSTTLRFGVTVTEAGVQCWREPQGGGTRTNLGGLITALDFDHRADATRAYHGLWGNSNQNSRVYQWQFIDIAEAMPPKGGGSTGRDPKPKGGRALAGAVLNLPNPPENYSRSDQAQWRAMLMRYMTQIQQAISSVVDDANAAVSAAWDDITGKPSVFPPDYDDYPPPTPSLALDDLTDVDTSGASSGDVLTFNGVDYDFQTPSGGGGSVPATTDVGDILAGDGAAFDILPVGADGEVLTADSGAPLGVSWQAAGGGGGGIYPSAPPTPLHWFKADAGITKNGSDEVTGWANQGSGSGNMVGGGGTAANCPLWVNNEWNGLPILRFRSGEYMSATLGATMSGVSGTILAVLKLTPSAGGVDIAPFILHAGSDFSVSGIWLRVTSAQTQIIRASSIIQVDNFYPLYGNRAIVAIYQDGAAGKCSYLKNGVPTGGDFNSNTSAFNSTTLSLGGRLSAGVPLGNVLMDFAEILVYPSVLSSDDMHTATMYLKGKWGIA